MAASARQNPFEFGGELKATCLIDREQELDLVIRTSRTAGSFSSSTNRGSVTGRADSTTNPYYSRGSPQALLIPGTGH